MYIVLKKLCKHAQCQIKAIKQVNIVGVCLSFQRLPSTISHAPVLSRGGPGTLRVGTNIAPATKKFTPKPNLILGIIKYPFQVDDVTWKMTNRVGSKITNLLD